MYIVSQGAVYLYTVYLSLTTQGLPQAVEPGMLSLVEMVLVSLIIIKVEIFCDYQSDIYWL